MLFKIIFELALLFLSEGFLLEDLVKTVSTPVGYIIGTVDDFVVNSSFSFKIQRYRGIPFAEAPIGNLRFKKPVPKAPFQAPYDARKDSFVCFQYVFKDYIIPYTMSEDCLRLNIYVPGDGAVPLDGRSSKPVMIWIHGGGFVVGESYSYDASALSVFGDVIVVTVNYRLAQYGFLSTANKTFPGNLGLWDQHLAIKWVHNNIQAFGGDINRVTLFGESAGSACVVFQAFYPGNKGLFHHAIAESGSSVSFWALQSQKKAKALARNFSIKAGCPQLSADGYISCLQSKPIQALNETIAKLPFEASPVPVLDHDFVLDYPVNLMSGDTNASVAIDMFLSIDFMTGFNSADGINDLFRWLEWVNATDENNFTISKPVYENTIIPYYMKNFFKTENLTEAAELEVLHFYTDWTDPNNVINRLRKLIDLNTDISFAVPGVITADLHINSSKNTYFYEFFARPLRHGLQVPKLLDGPNIAAHTDEIDYVLGSWVRNESENASLVKQYRLTLASMVWWSNFAKSG